MKFFAGLIVATAALTLSGAIPSGAPPVMSLRLELFVDDISESVEFYTTILGFEALEGSAGYAPVKNGAVILGLGMAKSLPKSHYFNPQIQAERRGLGTEIVLEVEDIDQYFAKVTKSGYPILTPLKKRPWGMTDFRVTDPDGYYLRITSKE